MYVCSHIILLYSTFLPEERDAGYKLGRACLQAPPLPGLTDSSEHADSEPIKHHINFHVDGGGRLGGNDERRLQCNSVSVDYEKRQMLVPYPLLILRGFKGHYVQKLFVYRDEPGNKGTCTLKVSYKLSYEVIAFCAHLLTHPPAL